jgi:hypothetical protein
MEPEIVCADPGIAMPPRARPKNKQNLNIPQISAAAEWLSSGDVKKG